MIGYRLSKTGIARRPYYIASIGLNLWSIEELCYFYHHSPALIDESSAGRRVTRWLSEEYGLSELALMMEKGMASGVSEHLKPLFEYMDYLSPNELREYVRRLDHIFSSSVPVRLKMRGDALLKNGKPGEAIVCYHHAEEASPEDQKELRSEAAYNCGTAAMQLLEYEEAAAAFLKAYRLKNSRENLKAYLTVIRLSKSEEVFLEELGHLQAEPELQVEIDMEIHQALEYEPEVSDDLGSEITALRMAYHKAAGT